MLSSFLLKGQRLGDKRSLEQETHNITGIDISALRGNPLSQFSVDDRTAWAARRKTKLEDDIAYCLLGLSEFKFRSSTVRGEDKHSFVCKAR